MNTIRRIIYLVLFAIVISCSSNSELVGSWQVDNENSNAHLTFSVITFKSDGTWYAKQGDFVLLGEHKLDKKENILTMVFLKENKQNDKWVLKIEVLTKLTLTAKFIEPISDENPNIYTIFKRI
jgi:hypothetical protein